MSQQNLNSGETGLQIRSKINGNFAELYTVVGTNSAAWAMGSSIDADVRALTGNYEDVS